MQAQWLLLIAALGIRGKKPFCLRLVISGAMYYKPDAPGTGAFRCQKNQRARSCAISDPIRPMLRLFVRIPSSEWTPDEIWCLRAVFIHNNEAFSAAFVATATSAYSDESTSELLN